MTAAASKSDLKHTTDTPYLPLTGELWGDYCEELGENWQRFKGTALYKQDPLSIVGCRVVAPNKDGCVPNIKKMH